MEPNPTHGNNDLNRLESALLRVLSNKLQFFRPIGFLEEDFINKFLYSFLCKNSTLICRLTLPHQYEDLNKLASTQFRVFWPIGFCIETFKFNQQECLHTIYSFSVRMILRIFFKNTKKFHKF